jgi:hypothetical protein
MRRVQVEIERLVLRGFRYEDRHAIAAGIQQELTRVLSNSEAAGHLANLRDSSSVQTGAVSIEQNAKPNLVGVQTARAIAARLVNSGRESYE